MYKTLALGFSEFCQTYSEGLSPDARPRHDLFGSKIYPRQSAPKNLGQSLKGVHRVTIEFVRPFNESSVYPTTTPRS